MKSRPLIAVTLGDPAGISPEIVARSTANPSLHERVRVLVLGTRSVLDKAIALVGADLSTHPVAHPAEGLYRAGTIDIVDLEPIDINTLRPGVAQAEAGRAAYQYMAKAIEFALDNQVDAIATAPINKEALKAGGVPYLDHTEMLAKLTHSPNPLTMYVLDNLRIFFLSRHLPLIEACRQVTAARVLNYIRWIDTELRNLGFPRPRIAVAGLNPHAGEGGLFGTEETLQIAPAVSDARSMGIDASGPIGADSVFHLCRKGRFDAVLSLYHDQGHIAAKTVDFERTVSVTLSVPFIRTSVDHGTAFDIAWKGIASSVSMEESIDVAARYLAIYKNDGS